MGCRQALSTAIKNEMLTLTTYFDNSSVFESPNFASNTPAALIVPSNTASDYSTSQDNKRVYAFTLLLLEKIEGDSSLNNVYSSMRGIEDAVMDVLDLNPTFSNVSLALPAGYAIIDSLATPSNWERVQDFNMGQFLVAEVDIRVYIDRDLS